ncbi:RND efflux system, membrane fusion protein [hydrothermal vent metagenome]|uniref:RND efflux system, membrane fusion protein n=1 Tax=hydrothermal vent metagenome TaxID=652676 RepID=A0A3B1C300_9ZZZZ
MQTGNRRFIYLAFLGLVLIGVITLIMIKGPLAPVSVQAVQLRQSDLEPSLFGIGTVEARRSYTIGPTRTGKLQQLLVDHGDQVVAGQLLGQMDPVDLPDRLQSAQLTIEKTEYLVEAAQAQLDEAKNRYAQAKREDQRYRDLVKKKQVSHEAAEAKATDALTTKDQVRAANANLEGTRHDLQRTQSDLKALQAQIDDLRLISPATGVVTAREAEPGSLVISGTPVLRIVDTATLWVRTRIDQHGSTGLVFDLPAEIYLRSQPDTALKGKVARIELIADSLTEERWIDVAFEQIPEGVAIGTLANVTIMLPVVEQAQWLPAAALQNFGHKMGAWIIQENRAHFVPVKTGTRTLDGKVQVLSGISSTDIVVIYSDNPLSEGQHLKVKNRESKK